MHWTEWAVWRVYWPLDLVAMACAALWLLLRQWQHLLDVEIWDRGLVSGRDFSILEFERFFAPNPAVDDSVALIVSHKKFYDRREGNSLSWSRTRVFWQTSLGHALGVGVAGTIICLLIQAAFIFAASRISPSRSIFGMTEDEIQAAPWVFALGLLGLAVPIVALVVLARLPLAALYEKYIETFGGSVGWVRANRARSPCSEMCELKYRFRKYAERARIVQQDGG